MLYFQKSLTRLKNLPNAIIALALTLLLFSQPPLVLASTEFTEDTIVSLSGISDGSLYVASGSECDSLTVSSSALTVSTIGDGQTFSLKTPQKTTALSISPTGGTADLSVIASNLSTSNGTISSWVLSASGSASLVISLGVPKANTNYTISTDADTTGVHTSDSSGQIAFTYSYGNFTNRTFTVAEGGTVPTVNSVLSNLFRCTNIPPNSAPWVYGAIPQDGNSITLYFSNGQDPYDKYILEYGTESNDYPYSVGDMGGRELRTYTVNSLMPNTTYYFRVRAGNGCMPGPWSNEISATTKTLISSKQLTFTSSLEPKEQAGEQVDEPNTDAQEKKQNTEEKIASPSGVLLKIKVTDTDKKPIQGAKVTLHSQVQTSITNSQGIAEFANVEKGEHKVIVAYNSYQGEQTVNLTGDYKEFNLNIEIKPQNILISPLVFALILIIAILLIFIFILIKRKRKEK